MHKQQISSIGSLGKQSQDWLRGEFEASLSSYRNSRNFGPVDLCVIYPTAENVRTRYIQDDLNNFFIERLL